MGPKKRVNDSNTIPLVGGEHMDMLRAYKRDAKRRKEEERKHPVSKQSAPVSSSESSSVSSSVSSEPLIRSTPSPPPPQGVQSDTYAYNSEGDSDLDSDDFEDVEIGDGPSEEAQPNDVLVSLDENQASHLSRKPKQKGLRKPQRLAIHKISLMAWMYHARMRNKWLMSSQLLQSPKLKHLIPQSVLSEIFPPAHLTPFLKSRQFVDGIRHAMEIWQHHFRVMRPGIACNQEAAAGEFGESSNFEEYIEQLLSFEGSLDLNGQGFVALLRSIGLNVRLVCSFQPPDNLGADTSISTDKASSSLAKSNYPIFWAEVWDTYTSKWMSVDPVTSTIKLPARTKVKLKLEPPYSDRLNVMRYCIALDKENRTRDVTRRYTKEFNSRTRKKRLPHFESEAWFDRFLGFYAPRKLSSLDKEEIIELARYPRLEGIPTRTQDFSGHPEYALLDQLRSNEVLRPGSTPCGIMSTSSNKRSKPKNASNSATSSSASSVYIYRRCDVETVRSSQSWYKRGRSIKVGEMPLTRKSVQNRLTGETDSVGLYAFDQTELYTPPPVSQDGTIPKSKYRTIDIFTNTMIPKGGSYIKNKLGTAAAKILKIDFANVVTGVDFGKRGPTSRMFGVVVAEEHANAVRAVIQGLRDIEAEEADRFERLRIMTLWRKFIVGIQIWDRVERMNPSYDAKSEHTISAPADLATEPQSSDSYNEQANKLEDKKQGINLSRSDPITASSERSDFDTQHKSSKARIASQNTPRTLKENVAANSNLKTITIDPARVLSLQHINPRTTKNIIPPGGEDANKLNRNFVDLTVDEDQKPFEKDDESSSSSHHSFSDIDVEEISESEL